MNLSEQVLMGAAAVAVTLIGFSGVVTALRLPRDESWSKAESAKLFALVAPSIVTLSCAFVPIGLGLILDDSDVIWRVSNGAIGLGHLLAVSYFLRIGSKEPLHLSHKIGMVFTVSIIGVTLMSSLGFGSWFQFTFLLGLLLGIAVSVNSFYLLLSPALGSHGD